MKSGHCYIFAHHQQNRKFSNSHTHTTKSTNSANLRAEMCSEVAMGWAGAVTSVACACVCVCNSGTKSGVQGSEAGQCSSRRPQQGRKLASASDSVRLCLNTAAASTVPHTRCGLSASLDSDLNHHYFSFTQCSEPHTHVTSYPALPRLTHLNHMANQVKHKVGLMTEADPLGTKHTGNPDN